MSLGFKSGVGTGAWRRLNELCAGRRGGVTNANRNGWWPSLLPRRRWAIQCIAQASQIRELYRWAKSSPAKGNVKEKRPPLVRVVTMQR